MLYKLIIFDIDGTLIASSQVWVPAVQKAMQEVYKKHALNLDIPTTTDLEAVIGIPGSEALKPFIPESHHFLIPEISHLIGGYGDQELRAGRAQLFPEVLETLEKLREHDVAIALASNCGLNYLHEVQQTFAFQHCVDAAFCLQSPGVRSKADMIAFAMQKFQTRRAVMVGDRYLDLQAAHQNGIPFLGFSGGFGSLEELPTAEGVFHHYTELLAQLNQREAILQDIGQEMFNSEAHQGVHIHGTPCSGKSIMVDELKALPILEDVPVSDAPRVADEKMFILYLDVSLKQAQKRFTGRASGKDPQTEAFIAHFSQTREQLESNVRPRARIILDNNNVLQPKRTK